MGDATTQRRGCPCPSASLPRCQVLVGSRGGSDVTGVTPWFPKRDEHRGAGTGWRGLSSLIPQHHPQP